MKPSDRQKMCSNCDGRIPMEAHECPYCGAESQEAVSPSSAQTPLFTNQSLQASLSSLYSPPYVNKGGAFAGGDDVEQEPSAGKKYKAVSDDERAAPSLYGSNVMAAAVQPEENESEAQNYFWPMLLLCMGANLLILGLLQLFFSDRGKLILEWDSSYWFIYCLLALPMVYFGFKRIQK